MVNLFTKGKLILAGTVIAGGLAIWASLGLQGCGDGTGFFKNLTLCGADVEASLSSQTRIGGASSVVSLERADGWVLYNVANDLRATQVGVTQSAYYTLPLVGYIRDIDVVEYPAASGTYYALVSMGDQGIAVVNVTDPTNMLPVTSMHVNYYQEGVTFTDGGGNIVTDNIISGVHGPISSMQVYDDGSKQYLLIANEAYGLHRTLLAHVFDTATGREADGTLLIDDGDPDTVDEVYTLQYAGERPWGGPKSLTLYKQDGDAANESRLFVAMDFLGMGIFNPNTMQQVGRYNMYTDASVVEDWFIDEVVADLVSSDPVSGDPYLDDFTGMPDYRQANFEVAEVWHNKVDAPAPWAAFDRYGKYYYNARTVDVATFNNQTIAYIAYALGGMVAVDVTGYDTAGPYDTALTDPFEFFLTATYLGYAPAVPANGPDEPTGAQSQSLYPYFGAGMLKEAGIVDVQVDVAGNRVFFSDHFAGLIAIPDADNPNNWHGPAALSSSAVWDPIVPGGVRYDNDTMPPLGNHWPDYEFINSWNMDPYDPDDNESLPYWLYESPTVLVTGEVSGHGNAFALMPTMDVASSGQVDVVMSSGGGGINFIDVEDLSAALRDGFSVLVHMTTTDELFREADGTVSTEGLSIGHSAGVEVYRNLLFLADGPHGMTVWLTADEDRCIPANEIHAIANTLQDEYAVDTGTEIINPAPHAHEVVLDIENQKAFVMSQSRGLRRIDISGVATEEIPVLLKPLLSDIYEHNTTDGSVAGLHMQDHTYDLALDGNLGFVADGSNGLTVYDLSKDPSNTAEADYVVGNIGGQTKSQPALGHATAVKLWTDNSDPDNPVKYAFVAAGHAGIGVVNVTDPANMTLVKVFEPIKLEEEIPGVFKYGKADGKSVDVIIVEDHVYFTYDSFGIVVYTIADLIKPLPEGMDPTDIWAPGTIGERPEFVARFKLQDPALSGSAELADLSGGAQGMFFQNSNGKHYFYIGYDSAGVAKIDWTDVANPVLVQHANTAGNAVDVAVASGRVYVADGAGGLVIMK